MIRPEDLKRMTPAQRAALSRKEVGARAQGQMKKPKPIKPITFGKRDAPKPRAVRLRDSKPVPMPGYKPRRVPGQALPAPMPTVEGNYGKPRAQQVRPKRIGPAGPKRKSPGVAARPKKKM